MPMERVGGFRAEYLPRKKRGGSNGRERRRRIVVYGSIEESYFLFDCRCVERLQ